MSRHPARLRVGLLTLLTSSLVLGTAAVASAHVHVATDSDVVGTDATLTFRVPTESDSASTVKVVVTLPTDPPLLSVSPQVVAGWTATVTEAPLPKPVVVEGTTLTKAPHLVTWTATTGGIPPEQFAELALLVENLPDAKQLTFPTSQYYSDGTVVVWDQPSPAGQPEPEHPVPAIDLLAAAAQPATAAPADSSDAPGRWLSVAALVLAGAALVVAVRGRGRRRGTGRTADDPRPAGG